MAIINPNQNPTLAPDNDVVNLASTAPSAHTWYATYTNNTGSSQTVVCSIPLGPLETTRSFTSTDTNVSGNTASGSTAIYDTLTVSAGGTVTYTIASTYTLASGKSFGTNTNQATFAVSGGSTYRRFQVVTVGHDNADTYQLIPERTHRDAVILVDRLVNQNLTLPEMQDLYDWIENNSPDFAALRKAAYQLGSLGSVSTAVDYTVRPEDFFVLETGNSKTITMPLPQLYPGRTLWVRDTGSGGVLDFSAGVLNGATGATAAATQNKTFGFFSNGSTWLTLAVQA